MVPVIFEQVLPTGNVIALVHSSLDGAGGTGFVIQISNPELVGVVGAEPAAA
jgi:hypothetical protein